jgi:hypothetical protein
MTNLLKETEEILKRHGKTFEDIAFCSCRQKVFSITEFVKVANFEYDNGYGGNEIDRSLMLVGKDFWLERGEYDGSEWWEYKKQPLMGECMFINNLYSTDILED